MADIAHVLHFGLADLQDMDDDDLQAWHDQACRILKAQLTGDEIFSQGR